MLCPRSTSLILICLFAQGMARIGPDMASNSIQDEDDLHEDDLSSMASHEVNDELGVDHVFESETGKQFDDNFLFDQKEAGYVQKWYLLGLEGNKSVIHLMYQDFENYLRLNLAGLTGCRVEHVQVNSISFTPSLTVNISLPVDMEDDDIYKAQASASAEVGSVSLTHDDWNDHDVGSSGVDPSVLYRMAEANETLLELGGSLFSVVAFVAADELFVYKAAVVKSDLLTFLGLKGVLAEADHIHLVVGALGGAFLLCALGLLFGAICLALFVKRKRRRRQFPTGFSCPAEEDDGKYATNQPDTYSLLGGKNNSSGTVLLLEDEPDGRGYRQQAHQNRKRRGNDHLNGGSDPGRQIQQRCFTPLNDDLSPMIVTEVDDDNDDDTGGYVPRYVRQERAAAALSVTAGSNSLQPPSRLSHRRGGDQSKSGSDNEDNSREMYSVSSLSSSRASTQSPGSSSLSSLANHNNKTRSSILESPVDRGQQPSSRRPTAATSQQQLMPDTTRDETTSNNKSLPMLSSRRTKSPSDRQISPTVGRSSIDDSSVPFAPRLVSTPVRSDRQPPPPPPKRTASLPKPQRRKPRQLPAGRPARTVSMAYPVGDHNRFGGHLGPEAGGGRSRPLSVPAPCHLSNIGLCEAVDMEAYEVNLGVGSSEAVGQPDLTMRSLPRMVGGPRAFPHSQYSLPSREKIDHDVRIILSSLEV